MLLAMVLPTTHSLANHHKPPHKPPSTEETTLESNLDGKPPKGYKPPPKHKPPTSLDGFNEEKPPHKEQP
ncbi:hypothetical protein CFP56_017021 [Quercus suber]|uniref:Proline-rich protein n=1 Tax=Quercus suber TaxID=58331 RepID=A0AAW0KP16_QUESU